MERTVLETQLEQQVGNSLGEARGAERVLEGELESQQSKIRERLKEEETREEGIAVAEDIAKEVAMNLGDAQNNNIVAKKKDDDGDDLERDLNNVLEMLEATIADRREENNDAQRKEVDGPLKRKGKKGAGKKKKKFKFGEKNEHKIDVYENDVDDSILDDIQNGFSDDECDSEDEEGGGGGEGGSLAKILQVLLQNHLHSNDEAGRYLALDPARHSEGVVEKLIEGGVAERSENNRGLIRLRL